MTFSMQLFSSRPYELEDDSVAAAAAAAAPFLFLIFVFLYFPYFGKMVTWIVPVFYLSSISVFLQVTLPLAGQGVGFGCTPVHQHHFAIHNTMSAENAADHTHGFVSIFVQTVPAHNLKIIQHTCNKDNTSHRQIGTHICTGALFSFPLHV